MSWYDTGGLCSREVEGSDVWASGVTTAEHVLKVRYSAFRHLGSGSSGGLGFRVL